MSSGTRLQVGPVAPADCLLALRWLFTPPGDSSSYADADVAEIIERQAAAALPQVAASGGLVGAYRTADRGAGEVSTVPQLVGVIWAQSLPGRACSLIGPQLASNEAAATADALLESAMAAARARDAVLVQSLAASPHTPEAERLRRHGFSDVAELLYMVSDRESFPRAAPPSSLNFHSVGERFAADEFAARLARIVEETYVGTHDCPELNGLRTIEDVLAGHRAVGEYDPRRWLLVADQERDVGCLLLADHPSDAMWELVYCGVVPAARGQGRGHEITRHAQWLACQAGREKLVLAVDSRNAPAIAVYQRAGFATWDRRAVLVRMLR